VFIDCIVNNITNDSIYHLIHLRIYLINTYDDVLIWLIFVDGGGDGVGAGVDVDAYEEPNGSSECVYGMLRRGMRDELTNISVVSGEEFSIL